MLRPGTGHSIAAHPRSAAAEATDAALAQAGLTRAEGVLCFATGAHGGAFPMVLRAVAAQAKTREVAGCGAMGVIGAGRETESGPGVSVTVFGGDSIAAKRLFTAPIRHRAAGAAREIAAAARPALKHDNLLCIFADTYNFEPDPFLATLARELPGVPTVGGGASEDGAIGETFQFCGDSVSSNACSGMLLSGDFDLNIGYSPACTPVGGTHLVTAVRDNILIELDGRPAFEIFKQVAGPLAEDLHRALAFVFLGVPLDPRAERFTRGGYVVRNIIAASAQRGVLAVSHRPKLGDRVALVLRDGERARADLKATLEEMSARIGAAPACGLYFDCVSRGTRLYRIPDHDSAYIRQYLGDFPIGGFFTGFEIAPIVGTAAGAAAAVGTAAVGAPGLLQYSGVLALVSQKTFS